MEVVVEYEYESLHEDELTLHPGDIITNVRRVEEEGWMEGDLHGKTGLFPDNFVKELKKDSKEAKEVKEVREEVCQAARREKPVGTVANLVQRMSTIGIPTGGFQPHSQASITKKKPKKRQCRVLFEYAPQNEDELELKVGEVIDISEEVEEGWWSGTMNGRSGLFPSNFVKEMETPEDEEPSDITAITEETDGSGGKEASATPTSPVGPPGNGVIAQPKKVRGIGFGDIFREGSVKLRARPPSPDKEEKRDRPIPSLPSAAKPAFSNNTDSQRTDGDSKSKAKEYCKVTFTFDSTNEDELSLKEGDIIQILSKDTGEPGWWRGEISGREGVFPDNFVTMISDADRETLAPRASVTPSPKQDTEEKPKKPPPPPSKHMALKPEVPSAERKPLHTRSEDKVDKPSKPAAPLVPPKKPAPPPGKGRLSGIPPKRPDKPLNPTPVTTKQNGELPSMRPKSDFEPSLPTKPKTLSGDWAEKTQDTDLMSFDDLSSSSEKLSHPTANRPKMPGRRLPAQFGGQSPNKEVNVEKTFRFDEDDGPKSKPTDTKKPPLNTLPASQSLLKPSTAATESGSSSSPGPSQGPVSWGSSPSTEPQSPAGRAPPEGGEDLAAQLEDMRGQMKELVMSVELIKTQQVKEIAFLRGELDEEKSKRLTLQMEIEKLKRTVQLT